MNEVDERIRDLEIRYTHQQMTIDALSDLVREQQDTIQRLDRELRQCLEWVTPESPANEKPPHY